ncbi:RHS repeat-associated core domain-containing protein [Agarilytica rhodophyticola]|uniref:RHS repeat-associated core domain-containing protein n=1 Tax=Agarilytica rhodophyticola TaxID=1737490 RepID=UPI000B343548|nr:RHS repeat-associated core domain-containing protein [Agarilytica rhodophyticola]
MHITSANLDARYSYTSDGRRLSKTVNGTTTYYLWDGTQLIAEYQNLNNQWQQTRRYDYLPGATTPQQMVDTTGVYTIIISDHLDGDGTHMTMNFRFPGQYFDQETGTHYNYFRTYDPRLWRYLQSHPLGQVDGPNTYAYARNNSLIHTDPYGLFVPITPQTIGGTVGFVVGFGYSYFVNGNSFLNALYDGIQSGAAGFISGRGSLFLGFPTAAGASAIRFKIACGSVNVTNAAISSTFAVVGGSLGKAFGALVPPKMVVVKRGFFGRLIQKIGLIGPKKIDANAALRANVSSGIGSAIDNTLGDVYSGLSSSGSCGCP